MNSPSVSDVGVNPDDSFSAPVGVVPAPGIHVRITRAAFDQLRAGSFADARMHPFGTALSEGEMAVEWVDCVLIASDAGGPPVEQPPNG
jgi:hypothetical protein